MSMRSRLHMQRTWLRLLAVGLAVAGILSAGVPAGAGTDQVDTLLGRLFGPDGQTPYDLTADFSGYVWVSARGAQLRAEAEGSFREWRGTDGVRRRTVRIQTLRLPLLLQPFSGALRRAIEENIETQADTPEALLQHDVFILSELPDGRFVLAGVHRTIVTDALERFGRPEDQMNALTRRQIARWLFNSPAMRGFVVRAGPPYALRAIVDDAGLLYELILSYDWGAVSTKIDFAVVNSRPVVSRVVADTVSDIPRAGRVTGQLVLTFFNHCVNCAQL